MYDDAPGSPELDCTSTPGALAARALTMLFSLERVMAVESTFDRAVPSFSAADSVPAPVTTTSPRRSGLTGSEKSWVIVAPEASVTGKVSGR